MDIMLNFAFLFSTPMAKVAFYEKFGFKIKVYIIQQLVHTLLIHQIEP